MWRCAPFGICLAYLIFVSLRFPALGLNACFCAQADKSDKYCGEILKFDPDDKILIKRKQNSPPIELQSIYYAECPADTAPVPPTTGDGNKLGEPARPAIVRQTIAKAESFGIYGSNTIGEELMPRLIKAYADQEGLSAVGDKCNGPIKLKDKGSRTGDAAIAIDCNATGSHTGIPALAEGRADIAMLSRPITPAEEDVMRSAQFKNMRTTQHEQTVALDGLLVIVSPRNQTTALPLSQIARIFSGEISDWSQLGSPAGKIDLYARDSDSGTRDTFNALVMEPHHRTLSPQAKLFNSSSELSDGVASDPRGIGFIGYAYLRNAKAVAISQDCGIVRKPSVFAIKTEDYPLSRRLFLYTAKLHSVHSQNLVFYALSDPAQPVVSEAGFINQSIEADRTGDSHARLREYKRSSLKDPELEFDDALMGRLRQEAQQAERLSVSFRFRPNSAKLDTKALQDILRLADYLKLNARNKRVLLFGFADAKGPFSANLELSRQRAEEVKHTLLAAGAIPADRVVTRGFSELNPVACNDDDAGREKNRRVEVWLSP